MAHTSTINCNNSASVSVTFIPNGGDENDIITFALEGGEFWFAIGYYKSIKTAKAAAVRKMAKFGYTFNAEELQTLAIS